MWRDVALDRDQRLQRIVLALGQDLEEEDILAHDRTDTVFPPLPLHPPLELLTNTAAPVTGSTRPGQHKAGQVKGMGK